MADVGLLENGIFIEAQRHDLVGEHVGSTAIKTRKILDKARGGVLFLDESYRLMPSASGKTNDFGYEAITELMSAMNQHDAPVMIFAGYEQDMRRFFAANDGLHRRICKTFVFADLNIPQLTQLLRFKVEASPFRLADSVDDSCLQNMLHACTTNRQRKLMNGDLPELVLMNAKVALDQRLTPETATRENIMVYTKEDLEEGLHRLPARVGGSDGGDGLSMNQMEDA